LFFEVSIYVIPLTRDFYDRSPQDVARDLLGKILIRRTAAGLCAGPIVETEAYLSCNDPACHASRGRTRKNATMFGPPGYLYVYPIHSRYCMNAVTETEGVPSAVLIRAIEPLKGIGLMQQRRGVADHRDLARGPARLCEALEVDRRLDGWDLTSGQRIWIAEPADLGQLARISISTRIGVTSAHELELRYFLAGSPFVSGTRRLNGYA
jgi:DNA-3-methyladenine glycosylase